MNAWMFVSSNIGVLQVINFLTVNLAITRVAAKVQKKNLELYRTGLHVQDISFCRSTVHCLFIIIYTRTVHQLFN